MTVTPRAHYLAATPVQTQTQQRPNFFNGRFLSASDLSREQDYHRKPQSDYQFATRATSHTTAFRLP